MRTERDKMRAGEPYAAGDPELVAQRRRARELCGSFNRSDPGDAAQRRQLLEQLLGSGGGSAAIEPPFFCDYGSNICLGEGVYFNFNCVVLDVCEVRVGDFTLFGPAVQIYTAAHPMSARERRKVEYGKPIDIGPDCWIGGGAIILPGVKIGAKSVIGAGSVVARDIPGGVAAAGNPCKVLRELADD